MKIGSLFSGYGGLDLGVQSVLGGEVVWHVEYDKAPSRILDHHWPDIPNFGDVTAVDFTAIEPVDILTGGYPCQPFSHAGKRKGTNDERHLWPHVLRAIGEMGPDLVVLENVRGHLSLGFDVVLADLASVGWSAEWGIVRASDAGACHQRARLFIVAYPSGNGRDQGRPESAGLIGRSNVAQCGDGFSTDASSRQLSRPASDGDGLRLTPQRGDRAATHASGQRHGRRQDAGVVGRMGATPEVIGREASAARKVVSNRADEDAAHADLTGSQAWGTQPRGARGEQDPRQRKPMGSDAATSGVDWQNYGPAIRRWEHVTRRPAPEPTEPGRTGNPRLSPRFVEWMMGLPDGWVTDPAIGISRNDQLKALGNGVVPQQAALALSLLLPRVEAVAA